MHKRHYTDPKRVQNGGCQDGGDDGGSGDDDGGSVLSLSLKNKRGANTMRIAAHGCDGFYEDYSSLK
jgi:hypothetical protein